MERIVLILLPNEIFHSLPYLSLHSVICDVSLNTLQDNLRKALKPENSACSIWKARVISCHVSRPVRVIEVLAELEPRVDLTRSLFVIQHQLRIFIKMATPSDDEEGLGPLERGRGRYQKGEYKGALAAFTEVCSWILSCVVTFGLVGRLSMRLIVFVSPIPLELG